MAIATDASIRAEIDRSPALDSTLREAVRGRRCLFVAGLPGAGKSLLVQRAAAEAGRLGRAVHLLRWDVARLAFDRSEILARYPEAGGVTHAAIRLAVGRWARGAVRAWDERNAGLEHLLVGETPLAGERLLSLARPAEDAVEPLLASAATLFLVPVPSRAVRRAIEDARAREMSEPRDERDRTSAPPHLVRSHWDEIVDVARTLGLAGERTDREYDPALYARVYRHLLRHRHVQVAEIGELVDVRDSVHAVPASSELVPTSGEVEAALAAVERMSAGEIERLAREWYLL